ncbi:MAG: hypothetical protein HFP81_03565 [Methylococcales symbiont of Hymedesmia sp. n. MRB-2018]|nr:MAG: hypothetical protein HFP78_05865 [Methylococcales symbiont of Hymedesmia sp. n. MRB-2018]KAF3984202.1 MAG: hypothetical protein HFP81_03565 [Methylococcales symbiont of Hymedesmia sp. n. MRB-2018]
MYIFILVNLYLGFLLETKTPLHQILFSDYTFYFGCFLLLLTLFASSFKYIKIRYKLRYDLFAVGATLVWFSYWPAFFRYATPMFDIYPLYFAFITALFSVVFISKRENIDPATLTFLQWLSDSGRFHPVIVMIAVIIGLAMPRNFLLFPAALTILIMRFTLASCLDNE